MSDVHEPENSTARRSGSAEVRDWRMVSNSILLAAGAPIFSIRICRSGDRLRANIAAQTSGLHTDFWWGKLCAERL